MHLVTVFADTVRTPMQLNTEGPQKIDGKLLITHHFKLDHICDAYKTVLHTTNAEALKAIIEVLRQFASTAPGFLLRH
jgi:alcohol dehydrogenase